MNQTDGTNNEKRKVKKNTWLRKLKALDLKLDRRQRAIPVEPAGEETVHVCSNCNKEFKGRFCPQCGQDATWHRFSWKQEGRNMLAYLGLGRQAVSKGMKKVFKRKAKKPKPIKKNTLKRKLRALDLKLDRRQQESVTQRVADSTARVCSNCGAEYTGRFCPQCGQAGSWSRFSWRQATLNLLDIWGLGSRPIFRTIRDLFWRPGYMVRDYLNGHRQYYFPPFKLLAVTLVLLIFVSFVVKNVLLLVGGDGVDMSGLTPMSIFGELVEILESHPLTGQMAPLGQALLWLFKLLTKSLLYEWLFIAVFFVFCIWIAFRRVGRYNFVETYIFLVFVLCQLWMVLMAEILGTGLCRLVEISSFSSGATFYKVLGSIFSIIAGIVSSAFIICRWYLFVLDFKQFYGLKWKSTVTHLIYSFLIAVWFLLAVVLIAGVFADDYIGLELNLAVAIVLVLLIPLAYLIAIDFLRKNKSQVTRPVSIICKGSMLSVFSSLILCGSLENAGYTILSIILMSAGYLAVAVALSLLPVTLYKKYHNTLLAIVPLLLVIAMVACLFIMNK